MILAERILTGAFYWIGIASALACVALVVTGNTELAWRLEHTGIPMSWAFGAASLFAFLAFEVCEAVFSLPGKADDRSAQLSAEWEAVEP